MKNKLLIIAIAWLSLMLSACEQEGPMEEMGEQVDNAVEEASESVEEAAEKASE